MGLELRYYAEDPSIAMSENANVFAQIHIWMKGQDRSIYEISVLYDFRLSELPYQL